MNRNTPHKKSIKSAMQTLEIAVNDAISNPRPYKSPEIQKLQEEWSHIRNTYSSQGAYDSEVDEALCSIIEWGNEPDQGPSFWSLTNHKTKGTQAAEALSKYAKKLINFIENNKTNPNVEEDLKYLFPRGGWERPRKELEAECQKKTKELASKIKASKKKSSGDICL
jgi:hypothetical protein